MSDRGLPTKKNHSHSELVKPKGLKDKKIKPKVKPVVLSSDSEAEPEVKKEKPTKLFDNYKEACNRDIDNYFIS
tara:strand:- start:710 stop:931 length:222 start_codon:yes stop_codon:yes gene_type:complete